MATRGGEKVAEEDKKRSSKRARVDDDDSNAKGKGGGEVVVVVVEEEDLHTLIGVHRVELAKSGTSHCGWCDTIIKKNEPRVVKRQYHGPGAFVRNSSSSSSSSGKSGGSISSRSGINPGGIQDLFLHPQCAWTHIAVNSRGNKGVKCKGSGTGATGCNNILEPGSWNFASRMGSESNRCTESSSGKLWQCRDCVKHVLTKYKEFLSGHISERSQFDEPVAWISRKNTSSFFGHNNKGKAVSATSNRPESKDRKVKKRLREVFRNTVLIERDNEAVDKHRALQKVIQEALKADKAQKRD
jgi:hypothetical protein